MKRTTAYIKNNLAVAALHVRLVTIARNLIPSLASRGRGPRFLS